MARRRTALRIATTLAVIMGGLSFLAPTPATAAPAVKPLLTGLLSREGPPPAGTEAVVRSYALRVHWKDLQPTAGSLVTTALDANLAAAAARGARVKLRVFAGVNSPDWAKQLGGPPVAMTDPFDGKIGSVPRFWTPEFGAAVYANLQTLLAARYDADPVVAEVVVSRCSAFYPEPFLRQTSNAENRAALLAAGYTMDADKACHRAQIDAHQVWAQTRSGLAFNPAQFVSATGAAVSDDAFTAEMMSYCRTRLGSRCVLENMSIRSPISSLDPNPAQPRYQRMYDAMAALGPPLAFQTAVEDRIGDCAATLDWAVTMRAAHVELPRDPAAAGCTTEVLAAADARLGRPTAPRRPAVAHAQPTGAVRVTWSAPATDAGSPVTGYRVLRSVAGRAELPAATLSATQLSWTDRPGRRTRVAYRVVAVSQAGPGPASDPRADHHPLIADRLRRSGPRCGGRRPRSAASRSSASQSSWCWPTRRTHQASASVRLRATPRRPGCRAPVARDWRRRVITGAATW